jgi:hypothetical protein
MRIYRQYTSSLFCVMMMLRAFLPKWQRVGNQGTGWMKLSIVIEIIDGECQPPQATENMPARYPGPLGTFLAQVVSPYLRIPGASASESCAQMKTTANCRTSSRSKGMKLDRSV